MSVNSEGTRAGGKKKEDLQIGLQSTVLQFYSPKRLQPYQVLTFTSPPSFKPKLHTARRTKRRLLWRAMVIVMPFEREGGYILKGACQCGLDNCVRKRA